MESKPSTIAKNKYNAKAYDRIAVLVAKGRRDELHAFARAKGCDSLNAYIKALIEADSGLSMGIKQTAEE